MSQASSSSSTGIGFFGLLTIVLIVLKLTGVVDWSWWIVFLPLLIPLAIVTVVLASLGLGGLIYWVFTRK